MKLTEAGRDISRLRPRPKWTAAPVFSNVHAWAAIHRRGCNRAWGTVVPADLGRAQRAAALPIDAGAVIESSNGKTSILGAAA